RAEKLSERDGESCSLFDEQPASMPVTRPMSETVCTGIYAVSASIQHLRGRSALRLPGRLQTVRPHRGCALPVCPLRWQTPHRDGLRRQCKGHGLEQHLVGR
ncbi:MAG: hypothetical protein NNA18_05325, partial [Nitrospira sp.]|nr:hypothetical protein [Nitrospira sp.]